jgi:hypothetical protein
MTPGRDRLWRIARLLLIAAFGMLLAYGRWHR